MVRSTFTWTVVPPNHLIRSVCNSCMRLVGVSANRGLLLVIQRVHDCRAADGQTPPSQALQTKPKPILQ